MSDPLPSSQPPHQAPIPQGLQNQLERFKKRLWQIKIAEAVLAGFFGLLFSFLLVFGLDRLFETPNMVRLVILLVGVSLFALFAPYWIRRWVYGHRRENQLAKLIARRYPRLGDRLLGAVELQDQVEGKDSLSPALRAAAMRTVAADAAGRDLLEALPAARHRKWSLVVMVLFLLMVAALITAPQAGVNALKRWLMPLANTERFTFTQLDLSGISTPHHVPYGETFTLSVPLSADTNRSPETARARYGNGEWVEASLVDGAYAFVFPAQRAADHLHIEADDARASLPVEPVIRPAVENLRAAVKLPAYLEREDISADLRSGFLSVLEGSEVTIQAVASRALSSGSAQVITLPSESLPQPDAGAADAGSPFGGAHPTPPSTEPKNDAIVEVEKEIPPRDIALKLNSRQMTTAPITMGRRSLVIPMQWTDIYGLKADKPVKLRLETAQDQLPSTYIQGIERQHIMLAEETIDFEVLAEDDYGLKACGISWQGEFTKPTGGTPAKGELTLEQGSPSRTTISQPFAFSPANLEIAPQKLTLRSWTEDYKPGRGRVYSEPVVLYILTRDEHAQVLKNEFDRAIGELEDIARKEQNLNDENQRLERKDGKDLQSEENLKKLQKQQDAERANKERMQELTKKMEELFKDAVRNGEIDKDALKKMSKALQSMRELSQEDLPKVEKKLQDAQSQRNTEEKSKEDMKKAVEEQKKALEKMKQALKDANEANQNFEASTFVNRLKRAANEQDGIASAFIDAIDKVIGSSFEELDPVEQRTIKGASDQQRQTASDVRWIQEDLAHYYARTQKEEHKQLVEAMKNSRIDEAMEILSSRVSANLSFAAITQSKQWAEQLRKWAKQLEGDQGGAGGGGEGGGGQQQSEDKDFEFMLKVMRMIQKEQDIRSRTRALENLRRSLNPDIAHPALPKAARPDTRPSDVVPAG
ncbi:hypothetical protein JIN77_02265 [Verrucomicrobiaceae bacterium R5-34]|uniref:Uncharacterized protein n=1 Tax=Oceaniferula flava TaxID=2800421 RepID=A0AAE2VAU5_9BACT|nr:hypothetical protein [Oceaniferula flavus]MBK1829536.1 hypothetical protein [Verrucomicrobiaceae bacterium R5-34]MBK1853755.1 hypothetical protein [Oceaniferula flavus]MBM1135062.1 hypothetical protein [Oceaniferula flavus]